ncbi:hypothetical protein [Dyadobacter sp. 676]|uniref:Uncharacterized protein n=1 Tax=Dyadobacter sp. 676 TaxID=3088362 RepID=A0AAU8FKW9_9BACT
MRQNSIIPRGRREWIQMVAVATLLLPVDTVQAQEGSEGNTTIFGGEEMTFFADHNFVTGGGAQSGVILTERATGISESLIFQAATN